MKLLAALLVASAILAPLAGPYLVSFEPGALYIRWDNPPAYAYDSYASVLLDCDSGLWQYGLPVIQAAGYVYYYEYWIPPNGAERCDMLNAWVYARPTQTWHLVCDRSCPSWPVNKVYIPIVRR